MTTSLEGSGGTDEGTAGVATNAESEAKATSEAAPETETEKAAPAAETGAAAPCINCKQPLSSTYYQIGTGFVCPSCKDIVLRAIETLEAKQRILPALGYGVGAAVAGSVLWYLIRVATGYEIGLVSIAIGVLVGIAVRRGSGGLGGRRYQVLAVVLTYLSITMTNVPLILAELRNPPAAEQRPASTGKPGGEAMIAPLRGQERPAPAAAPPASDTPAKAPPTLVGFLFAWVVIIGIALAAPFLAGVENIIGIAIIGFGVYEAWKINRHIPPAIQGPFTRGA